MVSSRDIFWFLRPTFAAVMCFLVSIIIASWLAKDGEYHSNSLENQSVEKLGSAIDSLVYPSPELSPGEVVGLQLAGLSDRQSARGILQCMTFASPANRTATGPLEHFGHMVRAKPFDVLSHPDRVLIGKTEYIDGNARILVTLVSGNKPFAFVWVLSKQTTAPFEDCWMTDAVFPLTFDNVDREDEKPRRRSLDAV